MARAHALIEIDLNVRVRGDKTYAGMEDVQGQIDVGDEVYVHESESRVIGSARVLEIDSARQLVFLSVDWASLWVLPLSGAVEKGGSEPYRVHQKIQVGTKPRNQGGRPVKSDVPHPRSKDARGNAVYKAAPSQGSEVSDDPLKKVLAA
jgi:hypothetical protein